jgi:hypothetical protein
MSLLKKAVVILVILSIISLHFPQICYCWQNRTHTKADTEKGVTKHTPEFDAPKAIKIPVETVKPTQMVEIAGTVSNTNYRVIASFKGYEPSGN